MNYELDFLEILKNLFDIKGLKYDFNKSIRENIMPMIERYIIEIILRLIINKNNCSLYGLDSDKFEAYKDLINELDHNRLFMIMIYNKDIIKSIFSINEKRFNYEFLINQFSQPILNEKNTRFKKLKKEYKKRKKKFQRFNEEYNRAKSKNDLYKDIYPKKEREFNEFFSLSVEERFFKEQNEKFIDNLKTLKKVISIEELRNFSFKKIWILIQFNKLNLIVFELNKSESDEDLLNQFFNLDFDKLEALSKMDNLYKVICEFNKLKKYFFLFNLHIDQIEILSEFDFLDDLIRRLDEKNNSSYLFQGFFSILEINDKSATRSMLFIGDKYNHELICNFIVDYTVLHFIK